MLEGISSQAGSYLLVFKSEQPASISVGRLGQLTLDKGYYFYIGSAFGPGGVRARVGHHYGVSSKPHWHLDYIRPALIMQEVWYSIDAIRHEHEWAAIMYYTLRMQVPLPGLGASDCRCESHFFHSRDKPERTLLGKALKNNNNDMNLTILGLI